MQHAIDRRTFLVQSGLLGWTLATPPSALLGTPVPEKVTVLRNAMAEYETAFSKRNALWSYCERAGALELDGHWEWFEVHPIVTRWQLTAKRARHSAEDVFTTIPCDLVEEGLIMEALDAYARIAPSSFALQTARDLFTPERFQTYPLQNIREALLADPDDMFEKTGMPGFLKRMRDARHMKA